MTTPDRSSSVRSPSPFSLQANRVLFGLALAFFVLVGAGPGVQAQNEADQRRLKVVFELATSSETDFELFLVKVENFQRNFSGLADIGVIATSDGVNLFRAGENPYHQRLATLADRGVDFMVCRPGMEEVEMDSADLLGFARNVRSGADEIEKLKEQGWAHVRDGESYVSDF